MCTSQIQAVPIYVSGIHFEVFKLYISMSTSTSTDIVLCTHAYSHICKYIYIYICI
jgi:hypothetical protein